MDPDTNPPSEPTGPAFDEATRIVVRNADNSVSIVTPNAYCGLSLAEIIAKDVPAGAQHKIVLASDLPADRVFRNAWEWVD